MIILKIDPNWLDIAYGEPETLNHQSVNSNSKITGTLGELATCQVLDGLGISFDFADSKDYDLIVKGLRFDVKSSRAPKYGKREAGNGLVTTYLRDHQKCDVYIFCCVDIDKDEIAVMGYCSKEWFWTTKKGNDYAAGEIVKTRPIKSDARLLGYRYLKDIEEISKWKA